MLTTLRFSLLYISYIFVLNTICIAPHLHIIKGYEHQVDSIYFEHFVRVLNVTYYYKKKSTPKSLYHENKIPLVKLVMFDKVVAQL
jgi:hypothetical protein